MKRRQNFEKSLWSSIDCSDLELNSSIEENQTYSLLLARSIKFGFLLLEPGSIYKPSIFGTSGHYM